MGTIRAIKVIKVELILTLMALIALMEVDKWGYKLIFRRKLYWRRTIRAIKVIKVNVFDYDL